MKIRTRKVKYTSIFLIIWFALLMLIIDGLGIFPEIKEFLGGSIVVTEIVLWMIVLIPGIIVYRVVKDN